MKKGHADHQIGLSYRFKFLKKKNLFNLLLFTAIVLCHNVQHYFCSYDCIVFFPVYGNFDVKFIWVLPYKWTY